jgi:hypothetical protein
VVKAFALYAVAVTRRTMRYRPDLGFAVARRMGIDATPFPRTVDTGRDEPTRRTISV